MNRIGKFEKVSFNEFMMLSNSLNVLRQDLPDTIFTHLSL